MNLPIEPPQNDEDNAEFEILNNGQAVIVGEPPIQLKFIHTQALSVASCFVVLID